MIEQTEQKLKSLRLPGMLQFYSEYMSLSGSTSYEQDLSNDEFLTRLVDAEHEERYDRKVKRYIKQAGFRQRAYMHEIKVSAARGLDRNLFSRISDFSWIKKGNNILLTGSTGTGKSFISCAIGHEACVKEHRVWYTTITKLVRKIREAQADMTITKLINQIFKQDLLIIDDFGLEPMKPDIARYLLEILDDRYRLKSTVISAQLPVNVWPKLFDDNTVADAIIDRLIHNSYRVELIAGEESMRSQSRERERVEIKEKT